MPITVIKLRHDGAHIRLVGLVAPLMVNGMVALFTPFAKAAPPAVAPTQLPSGGQVTSGAASIQQGQGPTGAPMTIIQQTTPKAIFSGTVLMLGVMPRYGLNSRPIHRLL